MRYTRGMVEAETTKPQPESLHDIEMVSFDVWLTLIKSNPHFKPARSETMGKVLDFTGEIAEMNQIVRNVDERLDHQSDSNGIQYGFQARVEAICEQLQGRARPLTEQVLGALEEEIASLMIQHPPLLLEHDLPDTLEQLKKRGKLAVVSNTGFIDGTYMRLALDTRGIWQHIDVGIFSNEAGVAKPNPQIFRLLAQHAALEPQKILHVGDNLKADYHGARNAGLRALHLSKDETIRSEKIATIRDLLTRLEAK